MDVDYTDREGTRMRIIGVNVDSKTIDQPSFKRISSELRAKYRNDDSIIVIFGIDIENLKQYESTSANEVEERQKMKSVRGIYYFDRDSSRDELRFYPKGITEKDLEN
jgi:hypothetical protein